MWSDRHCHASSIWLEHQFGALVCGSVQQASRIRLSLANVRRGSQAPTGESFPAVLLDFSPCRNTKRGASATIWVRLCNDERLGW